MAEQEYFEWESLRVREDRRDLLGLLLEAGPQIAGCERRRGQGLLTCVANHCGIDRSTVIRWLVLGTVPRQQTLDKLVEGTQVSLARWLVAFRKLNERQLADALGKPVPEAALTPQLRAWIEMLDSLSPAERDLYYQQIQRTRALYRARGRT